MRVPRIYVEHALSNSGTVELDNRTSHYLCHVLRLRPGSKLTLFNGDGTEYTASLTSANAKNAAITIESSQRPHRESDLRIELGQGISRGERLDFVFQKAVELGVHSLTPIWTNRCQVQLEGPRLKKRISHWRGIVCSACEQSGRVVIPALRPPILLDEWLDNGSEQTGIVLDPGAALSVHQAPRSDNIRILIGPEGGLSPEELRRAENNGFTPVRLGPRILRTETAAIATLAALQTLWGDYANQARSNTSP